MKHTSFALAAVLVGAFSLPALAAEKVQPSLSITATGTMAGQPDQAVIRFGVHSTSDRADMAMQANQRAMTQAFSVLAEAGIEGDNVATTSLALNPRYTHYQKTDGNTPPEISGYEAHNNVLVTVTDLDNLGRVLDSLVTSGVNGIDSVTFQISDTTELEQAARIKAAKEARAKAETYAEAIGTEITGVMSMSEAGGSRPQPYAMMDMARASGNSVPMAAGTQDISVTVSVVFGLDGNLK